MPLVNVTDFHFKVGDDYTSRIAGAVSKYKKDCNAFHAPLIGGLIRKLYETFWDGTGLVSSGDLIGDEVHSKAAKEADALYAKLAGGDSLNEVLDSYKDSLEAKIGEFKDDKKDDLKLEIFADLHFDKRLALDKKNTMAGIYTDIFTDWGKYLKKQKVAMGFILGNHDLSYELFKPRFEAMKKRFKCKKLKFIDRKVTKIAGYLVAGFGGSPEPPVSYGEFMRAANVYPSADVIKSIEKQGVNVSGMSDRLGDALKQFKKRIPKSVDVLLLHEAMIPNGGSNLNPKFIDEVNSLVKSFKPYAVFEGHFHGGQVLSNNGFEVVKFDDYEVPLVNPGNSGYGLYNAFDEQMASVDGVKSEPRKRAPKPTQAPMPGQAPRGITIDQFFQLPEEEQIELFKNLPPAQQQMVMAKAQQMMPGTPQITPPVA